MVETEVRVPATFQVVARVVVAAALVAHVVGLLASAVARVCQVVA